MAKAPPPPPPADAVQAIMEGLNLVPANFPRLSGIEILAPRAGLLQLRFTVDVTTDQIPTIAEAFALWHPSFRPSSL